MINKNNKPDDCKWFKWGEQMRLGYYYSSAFRDFEFGDKEGCDKCQLALGIFYQYGVTVEQDYEKAMELWEKSSKQGNGEATYKLAEAYDKGWGVKRDYEKGQQLFKKAYKQGYKFAECRIDDKTNKDK